MTRRALFDAALPGDMAVLAREGGTLKVTLHQLPSINASPLTTLAPARPVPLREQQYDVNFFSQASSLSGSTTLTSHENWSPTC